MSPSQTEPQDEAQIQQEIDATLDALDAGDISSTVADLRIKGASVKLRARRAWVDQHREENVKAMLEEVKRLQRKSGGK